MLEGRGARALEGGEGSADEVGGVAGGALFVWRGEGGAACLGGRRLVGSEVHGCRLVVDLIPGGGESLRFWIQRRVEVEVLRRETRTRGGEEME